MKYLPLLIFVIVVIGLFAFAARARRRQAATQAERSEQIGVGSDVMTTSGLYGTVVTRNEDDSVQLSVAPGVEVRWALAALRPVDSLPDRYRPEPADGPTRAVPGGIYDAPEAAPDTSARGVDLGKRGDEPGGPS